MNYLLRLFTLSFFILLLISFALAGAYEVGYTIGKFTAIALPFVLAYCLFRYIKILKTRGGK